LIAFKHANKPAKDASGNGRCAGRNHQDGDGSCKLLNETGPAAAHTNSYNLVTGFLAACYQQSHCGARFHLQQLRSGRGSCSAAADPGCARDRVGEREALRHCAGSSAEHRAACACQGQLCDAGCRNTGTGMASPLASAATGDSKTMTFPLTVLGVTLPPGMVPAYKVGERVGYRLLGTRTMAAGSIAAT
jgi:hypothetical protein